MEKFPIRMPTTRPGTSSRGRRDGRGPRGRLAAAVALVLGSCSAVVPVVLTRVLRAASRERPPLHSARGSMASGARTILDNRRSRDNIHTV